MNAVPRWIKRWRPNTVGRELALGFSAIVLLLAVISALALFTQRYSSLAIDAFSTRYARLADLSLKSSNSLTKARRYEKDFFLNLRALGFAEAEARYVTFFRAEVNEVRVNLREMRLLTDLENVVFSTRQIEDGLRRYEDGFLEVGNLYAQLGYGEAGLAGLLAEAANEVDRRVGGERLQAMRIGLLVCRQHEKDYLLRASDQDIKMFRQCGARLSRLAAEPTLKDGEREALRAAIGVYLDKFSSYVNLKRRVDTEQLEYLVAANTVSPRLDELYTDAWRRAQETINAVKSDFTLSMNLVLVMSISAVLIGFSIAWLVPKYIVRSVNASIVFAHQIAEGKLDGQITPPDNHREFADLANSLNTMAGALREARRAQESRATELEEKVTARTGELASAADVLRAEVEMRRLTEDALQIAKESAEAANLAKSVFVAQVSHEIRTPMNAIIGLTELMLHSAMSPQQRDFMGMIQTSAHSLLRLINDILDVSKMEAGKFGLERVEFNAREVIYLALKSSAALADSKGLELAYRIDPALPDKLAGDPGRLNQIIVNLVGNALRFTSQGEVLVHLERIGADDGEVGIHFSVSDTGIGIASEHQKHIFDAYVQADAKISGEFGGTGLGLTIVHQLVSLMRGRIWLESSKGVGTTIHFTASFGMVATEAPTLDPRSVLSGVEILVADDNRAHRLILAELLSSWGMCPTLVGSAEEAFSHLRAFKRDAPGFALALIDTRMPATDGFQLVAAMRAANLGAMIPIMMLSVANQEREVELCRSLGLNQYLSKPLEPLELLSCILNALGLPGGDVKASVKHPEPVKTIRPLRVLVADDHPINQRVICEILAVDGHRVDLANNGIEVLDRLDSEAYDAVLLDIQMPLLNGLDTAREIRRRERERGTPRMRIVAVTAQAMREDRDACLAAGMDDYVVKPIAADLLRACLEGKKTPTVPASLEAPLALVFDEQAVLKRVRGRRASLHRLIDLFLAELTTSLTEMEALVHEKEMTGLISAAHRLKGASSNLSAQRLFEAAAELEAIARGGNAEGLHGALAELSARASELNVALEKCLAMPA